MIETHAEWILRVPYFIETKRAATDFIYRHYGLGQPILKEIDATMTRQECLELVQKFDKERKNIGFEYINNYNEKMMRG